VDAAKITPHGIYVGTVADNPAIAAANAAAAIEVDAKIPESYDLVYRDGSLFIVGASAKGAMNGAFRLLDHLNDADSLEVGALNDAGRPVFRDRVAGHMINQHPPHNFSELDQARAYARHYINVVWGEKHGPPLSYAARKAYGLGLMVEVKFPPEIDGSRDYLGAAKYASASYRHDADSDRRVLDPFDAVGRQVYLDAYRQLLEKNPDTTILYALFGDYSVIPNPDSTRVSDGKAFGHSRMETMQQIMGIMREAVGQRKITCVGWLWHGFFGQPQAEAQFMAWLRDNGYGILYNEAGNNDDWLIRRDNFNDTALKADETGKVVWGPNYYPLVSAGGACESVNPVIAMPLPAVAAHKVGRLAKGQVGNLVLWWGSAEGWVYNPNLEVISRMIWEPAKYQDEADPLNPAHPDPLLAEVARAGFGKAHAADVLAYWQAFDHALVTSGKLYQPVDQQAAPEEDGLHINVWYQRMGIFTETVFSQQFARPLTQASLAGNKAVQKGTYWGTQDKTLKNYQVVTGRLASAQQKLKALLGAADLSPRARRNASQMYHWSELYRTLLTSQYDYLRALRAIYGTQSEPAPKEDAAIRQRLRPVIEDELKNIDAMCAVLRELPANANIRQPHLGVVKDQGSTADEIALLKQKAAAMKLELADLDLKNFARGAAATASSEKVEKGKRFAASAAVDGDMATHWASTFHDDEWLAVDLGAAHTVQFVRIHWKTAYPGDFTIEVSEVDKPAAGDWKTLGHYQGNDGVTLVPVDPPVKARHVRIHGLKQATAWGYAISELEVLGS
jgi:hypothetical protein